MRLKYWVISLVAILFSLGFPGITQGQVSHVFESTAFEKFTPSVLAQSVGSEPIIKFGYIKDSQPVSYENYGVGGYCLRLKEYLEKTYKFQEPDEIIPYTERFTRYKEITVECSANTISELRKQDDLTPRKGEFSEPFFTTSAKFLIRNSKRSLLNEAIPSFRIGVIGKTTSQKVVNSVYPTATAVPVIDRAEAIKKIKLDSQDPDSIDAYISDELLLESVLEELPPNLYSIEPKAYGFSRESYGVVVYDNQVLLNTINEWIKGEQGQEAKKNELDKKAHYNPISQGLRFLLSQDYFYKLVSFLLIFLPLLFLLLLFTHPLFITLIAKFPLFTRFLAWMRRRELRGNRSFVDPFIGKILHDETFNVIIYKANKSLVPMFIDRETVVSLIKVVGQPLLYLNNGDEPSTVEVEKVAQNLAQKAKSNPHFTKVLETVKDAANEETDRWIRNAVTRAFELLKQTVDPGGSSS